jgi:hypothetical protein
VAAPQVLHERVPGGDNAGRLDPFESAHRAQPGLEQAVIGFDAVVTRYEIGGALVSLAVGRGGLVGYGATVRDRGAGSEARCAGRCCALG